MSAAWGIVELVEFALRRTEEAERRDADYIFVAEIYRSATRISSASSTSQQLPHCTLTAREMKRAFVLLRNGGARLGWVVDDYGNVNGDRAAVNAAIPRLRAASDRRPQP
jgi:hypothetical protein